MSKVKENVFVSVDVETTGDSPCTSSCIMIGCVVFRNIDVTKETSDHEWILEKKRWCIEEIEGRPMDDRCYREFWSKNQQLLEYIKSHAVDAKTAMKSFAEWYSNILSSYNCTFIARPSSFDWQWINCIYDEFGPENKPKLPFSIICVSSIMKLFGFLGFSWDNIIKPQLDDQRYGMTHYADDDALYQAYMFVKTMAWLKNNMLIKN
ncbi:DNA polymerase III subunit epsilon [Tupanvirus deep ocean]|uniref:DNA polymerase III subunit epsilon n=2 Tax=Tupanvirus TaxID=2094720 RepID=A0AC62A9C6_9VIRU|nr:DNA polymerase III subunit epsilon [Tupanvirus deep ocean]QKU34278.1 DNA polymerase III subunit epsilon [Tupanvirus deep ocean]